jgi:hypothetical protein
VPVITRLQGGLCTQFYGLLPFIDFLAEPDGCRHLSDFHDLTPLGYLYKSVILASKSGDGTLGAGSSVWGGVTSWSYKRAANRCLQCPSVRPFLLAASGHAHFLSSIWDPNSMASPVYWADEQTPQNHRTRTRPNRLVVSLWDHGPGDGKKAWPKPIKHC